MKKVILVALLGFGAALGNDIDEIVKQCDRDWTRYETNIACQKLEEQCKAKDTKVCYELGKMFSYIIRQRFIPYQPLNDYNREFESNKFVFDKEQYFYQQACELGNGEGCYKLGEIYNNRGKYYKTERKAKDVKAKQQAFVFYKQAVQFYQKGCDLKNAASCYELIEIYNPREYQDEYAEIVDKNGTKADEYWNLSVEYKEENQAHIKGCAENNATACSDLARAYVYGGKWGSVSGQKSKTAEFYEKACSLKDSWSCRELGKFYEQDGNMAKAYEFYTLDVEYRDFDTTQKCQANDGEACYTLGKKYNSYSDEEKYKQWRLSKRDELYQKACDLKYSEACVVLGKGYEEQKDIAKAVEFFAKACKMNESQGCVNAGILYKKGEGIAQDISKAADLYKKACELEHSAGCNNLALIYEEKGKTSKAREFYNQACRIGSNKACVNLRNLRIKEDF